MRTGIIAAILLIATSTHAFAEDVAARPATAREIAKLSQFADAPRLVDCMTAYKFDFFAQQLGFSIDGEEKSEAEQLSQFRDYLNTGKLQLQNVKMKLPKDLPRHCAIVAQTAVEMLALKLAGKVTPETESN